MVLPPSSFSHTSFATYMGGARNFSKGATMALKWILTVGWGGGDCASLICELRGCGRLTCCITECYPADKANPVDDNAYFFRYKAEAVGLFHSSRMQHVFMHKLCIQLYILSFILGCLPLNYGNLYVYPKTFLLICLENIITSNKNIILCDFTGL